MQVIVFELMNTVWFLKPLNFPPGKKDCFQLSSAGLCVMYWRIKYWKELKQFRALSSFSLMASSLQIKPEHHVSHHAPKFSLEIQ